MKRLLTVLQWLGLVALLAYIAWRVLAPDAAPEREVESWRSWDGFYALSYKGVRQSDDTRHIQPRQLREHLSALAEAGYRTVDAEDVAAFLAGESPLPRKALMLLFEEGRKDSLVNATPLLEESGFVAMVCIPTGQVRRRSVFADPGDVSRAGRSPHWRLCSMGHDASELLDIDPDGGRGHFLSQRRWLEKGPEGDEVFRARVLGDYARAVEFLSERGDGDPGAYLYPYSDRGTGRRADPLAAELNREGVRAHHRVAFTRNAGAFNGPESDPFDLTRLQVSGAWDAPRLLAELEAWAERRGPVALGETEDLFSTVGDAVVSPDRVDVSPGAAVWVRGSDAWTDQDVIADVELLEATSLASLYVRWSSPHSSLRLSLRGDAVRLQERLGTRLQTLALSPVTTAAGSAHSLRLRVKGNRVWAWLDGVRVAGPVPLAATTVRGRTGVGGEAAAVRMVGFRAEPIDPTLAISDRFAELSSEQREAVTAFLPAWRAETKHGGLDEGLRRDLLEAAAVGIEVIPRVSARPDLAAREARLLAHEVARTLAGPVAGRLVNRIAIRDPSGRVKHELRDWDYAIVHIATPDEALVLVEEGRLGPDDLILIDESAPGIEAGVESLLHHIPPARVVTKGGFGGTGRILRASGNIGGDSDS